MMAVMAIIAVAYIGVVVVVGYAVMQGLVFMLEIVTKVTEELR